MNQDKAKKGLGAAAAPAKQKAVAAPLTTEEAVDVTADVSAIDGILQGGIQKKKRRRQVNLCHACGMLGHAKAPVWHDEDEIIENRWACGNGVPPGKRLRAGDYPVADAARRVVEPHPIERFVEDGE
jgi:hypothetical protein